MARNHGRDNQVQEKHIRENGLKGAPTVHLAAATAADMTADHLQMSSAVTRDIPAETDPNDKLFRVLRIGISDSKSTASEPELSGR